MSTAAIDPAANALIEASRERGGRGLRLRTRRVALAFGVTFVVVAIALTVLLPTHRSPSVLTILLFVAVYACASRVKFEVGTGLALPTQVVLVPMLFLLPLGEVPLVVAAALLLGRAWEFARRRTPLDHALLILPNSWYVVGPVLVLAAGGEGPPDVARWPLYLGALAAQFAADYASSWPREYLASGLAPGLALRYMRWAFLVDAALAPVGFLAALAAVDQPAMLALVVPLLLLLGVFARERQVRIDHALELSHAYRGTALLLGDVVEADDAYTGSHSRDVVSLVLAVCDSLGLDAGTRRDAEFAALLHDVGKIKIPAEVINKPGALDPDERALIETHTLEGERLLSQVGGILGDVGRIIRSCHENWDGTGYPDGLAGTQIPLPARIVRCCDAFSAMTTDRPYRRAGSPEEAIAELRRCAGTHFDPDVVRALVAELSAA